MFLIGVAGEIIYYPHPYPHANSQYIPFHRRRKTYFHCLESADQIESLLEVPDCLLRWLIGIYDNRQTSRLKLYKHIQITIVYFKL